MEGYLMDEVLIIDLLLLGILALVILNVATWIRRHRLLIDLAMEEDSSIKSKSFRVRIQTKRNKIVKSEVKIFGFFPIREYYTETKQYLFKMNDLMAKNPFPLTYEDCEKFTISAEGLPFFGINKVLNIKKVLVPLPDGKTEYKFIPWCPLPIKRAASVNVDDYTYSWSLKRKIEIWEQSQTETKGQALAKLLIPMGMIVLAIVALIFLPKIIDKIREPAMMMLNQKTDAWLEAIRGAKPIG